MSKVFWGIDIGRSALKAVKIEKHKGNRLEIVDLDLIEFEIGDNEDVDRDELVRDALQTLKSRRKLGGEPLFFSIPGHGTFNRTVSLPPVDAKQIPEMVKYEAQQQIPFPIEEVIWGWQKVDKGEEFGEVEVNLFAVRKEVINNFIQMLNSVGLDATGIQIAPLALFNFITYDQKPQGALVAVDMGAEFSELVVINGSRIWIRNLQIAGNEITRAIASKFQIPFGEAEKLKVKAVKSKHANKIFQVMKPILKDLVAEIHRSVGFYKSQNQDIRFEQFLLLGNGTKLVGFKRFFRDHLPDYNIEIFKGLQRIGVSRRVNINLLEQNAASFCIAIGLAIQAAGEAINNVVLVPEEKRQAEALNRKKPLFVVALMIIGAVAAYKYMSSTALLARIKVLKGRPQAVEQSVSQLKERWATAQNWGALPADVDGLNRLEPIRSTWVDVVSAIYGAVPVENNKYVVIRQEEGAPSGADDPSADHPKAWLADVAISAKFEERQIKDERNPSAPARVVRRPYIEALLLVCIRSRATALENSDAVRMLYTSKLETSLKALVETKLKIDPKQLEILQATSYFWVDNRDPLVIAANRAQPGSAQSGRWFIQPITARIPLAAVPQDGSGR